MTQITPNHTFCRICDTSLPPPFLSLGQQPLANNLSSAPDAVVPFYPLELTRCLICHLVQLTHVVDKHDLFDTYLYTPSQSRTFVEHFTNMARNLQDWCGLRIGELVVDIGANDQLMLSKFRKGIRTLGVEPATNIEPVAIGMPTVRAYWSSTVASSILRECGPAQLITATNVFAHVDNLHDFVAGIDVLLAPDGTFVIEAPGLLEMINSGTYDLIYSEHQSFLAVAPLVRLFDEHDMSIYHLEETPIHGGSIRLFIQRRRNGSGGRRKISDGTVGRRLGKELNAGLSGEGQAYTEFAMRIKRSRERLLEILRNDPKPTIGYTAPAKATTIIYYCGLTNEDIYYICDDSSAKQGKYIPGTRIIVTKPEDLILDPPIDRVVVFAWNIYRDILPKLEGRCKEVVIPMPEAQVLRGFHPPNPPT